jgi:hypothetical protein
MRNGGLSTAATGGKGYSTRRILKFGEDKIVIEGDVSLNNANVVFEGSITGRAMIPDDLTGNSIFIQKLEMVKEGELRGIGEGSLFKSDGRDVQVTIVTLHTIRPTHLDNPLSHPQFRITTSSRNLSGLTYHTIVHSIVDGINTMERNSKMQSSE